MDAGCRMHNTDLEEVTPEALHEVISNYEKVMELTAEFTSFTQCRAVIIMGSPSDQGHAEKIAASCRLYGITPILRISSAHKATSTTLDIMSEYEADEIPTVIIAVAGLSNGLGPVLSGNSTLPVWFMVYSSFPQLKCFVVIEKVINCPPVTDSNIMLDMWSSIRMPSGIGCATVIGADESALCAAKLFASQDHMIFGKILTHQLNNLIKLLNNHLTCK
ncbi:phosphoribosylaminoimidazole carboxylase [Dictyocaulus viviparus]|uniref:Phosphoribosylaminoimidazole carboxylase n=1 Tax=Dictyocaulus viviparus TaxID=29172 RepID=A0A0D8XSY6_DICVI|nr:phosphoribosylaminoimidazole carboxylase [Dictyocaulus viviparus]